MKKEIFFLFKKDKKSLLFIIGGTFINVLGLNLFLTPLDLFPIGVMGLAIEVSMVIKSIFNWDVAFSIFYFVLNVPLMLLAWHKIGKRFTIKTFLSIFLATILIELVPSDKVYISDNILLSLIMSGVFSGVGLGLLLKAGSSTGGTDIIALYMSLDKGKTFGTFTTIFNAFVIIFAVLLVNDITMGVYMLVLIYVLGLTTDKIHNIQEKMTLFIITNEHNKIREYFVENSVRGITIFDTRGGYTNLDNTTMMMTVDKGEATSVINAVKEIDTNAFINILPTKAVVGQYVNSYKRLL